MESVQISRISGKNYVDPQLSGTGNNHFSTFTTHFVCLHLNP